MQADAGGIGRWGCVFGCARAIVFFCCALDTWVVMVAVLPALSFAEHGFFMALPEFLEGFEEQAVGLDAVYAYAAAHGGCKLELQLEDSFLVVRSTAEGGETAAFSAAKCEVAVARSPGLCVDGPGLGDTEGAVEAYLADEGVGEAFKLLACLGQVVRKGGGIWEGKKYLTIFFARVRANRLEDGLVVFDLGFSGKFLQLLSIC